MAEPRAHHAWNFDIDRFLNPMVPSPPWNYLPYPIAHFLGYRKTKPSKTGNLMPIFWAFMGIFCAIVILQVVSTHVSSFERHHAPAIVGSFGATAVLEFYAIESPLSQPRNAFFGQVLSSVVGVSVARLFLLSDRFDSIQYLGGAVACAAATSIMALTKTVHPPAGATALLAVVDSRLVGLGWFLVPVMALGTVLMVAVALLVNNLQRRFPVYWWTPEDLRAENPILRHRDEAEDVESQRAVATAAAAAAADEATEKAADGTSDGTESGAAVEACRSSSPMAVNVARRSNHAREVVIRPGDVLVPRDMYVTQEEMQLLETLSKRI